MPGSVARSSQPTEVDFTWHPTSSTRKGLRLPRCYSGPMQCPEDCPNLEPWIPEIRNPIAQLEIEAHSVPNSNSISYTKKLIDADGFTVDRWQAYTPAKCPHDLASSQCQIVPWTGRLPGSGCLRWVMRFWLFCPKQLMWPCKLWYTLIPKPIPTSLLLSLDIEGAVS